MNRELPGDKLRSLQPLPDQDSLRAVLSLGEGLLSLAQQLSTEDAPSQDVFLAQRNLILDRAARVSGGQVSLWLSDEILRSFPAKGGTIEDCDDAGGCLSPLMRYCLEIQRGACGANSAQAPFEEVTASGAQAVAVPLLFHDRLGVTNTVLGVLQAERLDAPPFSLQEIGVLEGMAVQAALVLHASLRMASERWRQQQLALVRQVSLQIADLRGLDELARRVTSLILQTFDYYYAAIFTLHPAPEAGQSELHFRASAGPSRPSSELRAGEPYSPVLVVRLGEGIIGHVAQTGEEVIARNVQHHPLYRHVDVLPETRSEVALPLTVRERLVGVLDVQSDQPDDFDQTDMLVLHTLAGNIALAVEDAYLYSALSQRAAQLAAIYEVSSAITSILDQREMLNQVVSLIHERFGYPYVHLFTVHPGRQKIFYEAGSGLRDQELREQAYAIDLEESHGMIPWVARHGETILANDVSLEPRYVPSSLPPDETLSELTVPLIFGGEVLGVLDVQSDQLNAFSKEDRFLFEALADHIAIALRNANLYRSESWRRRVADSLREVAGLLSADVELDQVLEAILAELERTLPLDAAAIWLLDTEKGHAAGESEDEEALPALHLAAVHGASAAVLGMEIGLLAEDVQVLRSPVGREAPNREASTWLMATLRSETPAVRSDQATFEPLGIFLGLPEDYSAIAAPLRVGDQPLGLLTLVHHSAGRYGSEASAMTAAFASYAAVAIENARLYEAAHEQAWVSTVLLQVAEATQSKIDLDELLSTVIRITPMLAGVRACLLYILDEDGDFLPAAASGLEEAQEGEFERVRFAPGDVPVLDRLLVERRPLILHGDDEDIRLFDVLHFAADEEEISASLAVLVPLLARGEVLGAFLVDYSAGWAGNGVRSVEAFFDERLAILQGIAHQTAIAVDNIHLLKLQKEEAYVSVALLQVAQAVVSSNDLDESLGSIVRITPILVGVKRAIIFLWDEPRNLFHLSQAYGIPRSEEAQVFGLGDFPLLDAVLLEDSLLALPLWGEISAAENAPAAWARLAAPDLERVDEYLENAACLLIAIPLSIRGKVLGVFLVEEPQPVANGMGGSNVNRRLREKRLEIITGISQQTALAIQTDQLQREMVERERLEREMQLAREIQLAFLPQSVPEMEGWDIQVYWRTARQVGGDFYDFIELPGNRMGLVIADVADKGMPAALFVTLARTLVRATALEVDAPEDVLERVNDILVPDAPQGMFVTLAYVVVDLDTGVVEYANAGHNPPLWLRAYDGSLERLARTGMALGVLEGNPILGRRLTLEDGDYLIMYTDGVTEAFSPDDQPFGEEHLQQVIKDTFSAQQEKPLTAQAMLEAIDQAVVAFMGSAIQSDDLTLVVLKRIPLSVR